MPLIDPLIWAIWVPRAVLLVYFTGLPTILCLCQAVRESAENLVISTMPNSRPCFRPIDAKFEGHCRARSIRRINLEGTPVSGV
jgi:hypothetical protein